MPAGDAFTPQQRYEIQKAADDASEVSGVQFSVYVADDTGRTAISEQTPRARAIELHGQLANPDDSVLVYVDPVARALEIVTGVRARQRLDDAKAGLAALSMNTSFAAGQLASGLVTGIRQMGEGARRVTPILHVKG